MAQQLWLLRHGEAEPHGVRDDAGRELTDRGREQSRAAGRALAATLEVVHAVYTSPRVRARDTALLACAALGVDPVVHEPLTGGFEAGEAIALLGASDVDDRVLLVGHEPDLSQIAYDLTGARIDMKKGGVAGIRMTAPARGELIVLLRPRELARIS